MADECILEVETEIPVNFTCATGTTIEKGAVCAMTDNMVAVLSTGDTDIVAGIAQSEKLAAETSQNSVAIYRRGIFRGVAGVAGVVFGEAIITDASTSSTNRLVKADNQSEQIMGIALETATSGNRFLFELGPRAIQLT